MFGNKRNRHECVYGCCNDGLTKRAFRRMIRAREKSLWKKEAKRDGA